MLEHAQAQEYGTHTNRERLYLVGHRGAAPHFTADAFGVTSTITIEKLPLRAFWPSMWWVSFREYWLDPDHPRASTFSPLSDATCNEDVMQRYRDRKLT